MKSLMLLLQSVLSDAETWCRTSAALDRKTIERRYKHEGLSFLTITLPTFCSDFERGLEQGSVDDTMFLSFKKRRGLPQFLGGFLRQVFDLDTGNVLEVPSTDAIFFIRQITLLMKKVLLPCTIVRERDAFEKYVETDREVHRWERTAPELLFREFSRLSSLLWAHDLSIVDRKVFEGDHVPRHGPGATAERVIANDKFNCRTWTERLESYFPALEFLVPNAGFRNELDSVDFMAPEAELPSRVISVPKTLKTPRIIAIEPVHMQYAQQSLLELLVRQIEKSDILLGSIGFTDQKPNQWMAQLGSIDQSLATIDLSEASDRVSNRLVAELFGPYPSIAGAIQASRSQKADVPGHGIIPLAKFASMGSATCFPVEAMVFTTIVLLGIQDCQDIPFTKTSQLREALRSVRVYGDDIIVPTPHVRSVMRKLEDFGLRVNAKKTFHKGFFRESCGGDFFKGVQVTPVYLRRMLPTSRKDVPEIMSLVSFRNQLYRAGLWKTVAYADNLIKGLIPFPVVGDESPVLGRHSFLPYQQERLCPRLHRPLVRGAVIRTKKRRSPLQGYGALMKFFLKRGVDPNPDEEHLERSGRPLHVDIKVRWASAA